MRSKTKCEYLPYGTNPIALPLKHISGYLSDSSSDSRLQKPKWMLSAHQMRVSMRRSLLPWIGFRPFWMTRSFLWMQVILKQTIFSLNLYQLRRRPRAIFANVRHHSFKHPCSVLLIGVPQSCVACHSSCLLYTSPSPRD